MVHIKFYQIRPTSSGLCCFGGEDVFVFPMTPRGSACMDPRGTVGRIYKEDHYSLLHTKYESSGPCGFGDFFHCKSMGANDPRGRAIFDPSGMVGRIYKEDYYTLLQTKYKSSGSCGLGEDFLCFSHGAPKARPVWTPGARLAGFIKMTTIHCYTQNTCGFGEEDFFLYFPM